MAKQAKIEDIMMPIFDGVNYSSWKLRLVTLLEYKECNEPAICMMPVKYKNQEADWKKMDLKARTIIMSTISDKQLEYISECTTAYDMLKKFDKMYLTQSTAMQIICRGKIEEIKLNNYNTVEDFFVDFEKTTNDFKAAGGSITEPEKMRYLLRALPPSYSFIGDFIDVIPEEQRTVDYVKSKIKEKNMTNGDPDKKSNMSTFSTKTKAQCFICGKTGHLKKDCWHGQKNYQGRYPTTQRQPGQQRGYYRGVFHRGRGRGRGQGYPGGESTSAQQDGSASESWAAQFVAAFFWEKQGWPVNKNPVSSIFRILWIFFEPILFAFTGAQVTINALDTEVIKMATICLVSCLVLRAIATFFVSFGCGLNSKEKLFIGLTWTAKATVQAALGPAALDLVNSGKTSGATKEDEAYYAKAILAVSVLSVMISAPLGALLIALTGPKLLTKDTEKIETEDPENLNLTQI